MERIWPGNTPDFLSNYRSPAAERNIIHEPNNFSPVELQEIAIKIKQFLGPLFDYENVRLDYIRELSRRLRLDNELTDSNLETIKYYLNAPHNVLYSRRTPTESPISHTRPSQSVSTSPDRYTNEWRASMRSIILDHQARREAMSPAERDAEDREHMRRSDMAVRTGDDGRALYRSRSP
jgi:hypothetical protein